MTSVTEKLNLKFCLIVITLHFNIHPWLVATILDSAALEGYEQCDSFGEGLTK